MEQIRGNVQLLDESVQKKHLDITTPGEALITNIIAGSGVSIEYTGADEGTGEVTITASGGGAVGDFVEKSGDVMSGPLLGFFVVDTEENILASTPTSVTVAYATDIDMFYLFDGTDWRRQDLVWYVRDPSAPDMGLYPDNPKSKKVKFKNKKEMKDFAKKLFRKQEVIEKGKGKDKVTLHYAVIERHGRLIELYNTDEEAMCRDALTLNRIEVEYDSAE